MEKEKDLPEPIRKVFACMVEKKVWFTFPPYKQPCHHR